jgi:hypothetical protein
LVTLGILTVLSVLAVAFFSVSRIQRQTAASRQYRDAARNALPEALHLAMRTVEDAFCYTNFTAETTDPAAFNGIPRQRLAPVGFWFSEEWQNRNETSQNYAFQAPGLFVSPLLASNDTLSAWTANLLTSEVLSLVPPALTNALDLSQSASTPFRAGWQQIDDPGLNHNATRIAFAVFDLSGFLDANYFIPGPSTQKLPRTVFSQADVTNWTTFAIDNNIINENLKSQISNQKSPFSALSYDPDPDADPFVSDSARAHPLLGYDAYARTRQRKFDINSVTNLIGIAASESGNWLTSAALMSDWLRPVYSALARANADEPDTNPDKLTALQSVSLPWNLLNFIDADRVPQLSPFAGLPDNIERIATRANLAVEDVPLINKVTVFNIFGGENGNTDPRPPAGHEAETYYGITEASVLEEIQDRIASAGYDAGSVELTGNVNPSNYYAVAVELWYPFTPAPLPSNTAFYAVLSTNAADTATTTNRPLSSAEIEDWFRWNEAATSNTVMQTLFYAWANAYTNAVGPGIWQHPLWQVVTTNADTWFTTNMVNHPSWPVPGTDGRISISNTPIWQAFYPETYEVRVTNQVEQVVSNELGTVTNIVDVVTTNVYTYATTTNDYVYWVSEPDMATNRFIGQLGVTEPDPYPVLLWDNLTDATLTTNVFLGFVDTSGNDIAFFTDGETNHLQHLYALLPDGIVVVSSNGLTGAVSTNHAAAFVLAPWTADAPLDFTIQTNLYVATEILPVKPLPMPEELGATLDALFGILLAPELSLDTSEELYDFLMALPSEFEWWEFLGGYLAQYPFVQQTIMPSVSRPRTDNLFPEDRIDLTDDTLPFPFFLGTDHPDGETVAEIYDENTPPPNGHSFGTYITVYPKKTISFLEVTFQTPEGGNVTAVANFYPLGSKPEYVLYFRPVVTLDDKEGVSLTATPTADGIPVNVLDEALLVHADGNVYPFYSVTNLFVADPRDNGYINRWFGFPDGTDWDNAVGTTNLSTQVTEYPFIHLNAPLTSQGDIGHIYTSPDRLNLSGHSGSTAVDRNLPLHDTISFSSRSGAALLDMFTVHATPSNLPPWQAGQPWRGLVQANTPHPSVVAALFADAALGWTNANTTADSGLWTLDPEQIDSLTNRYINAQSFDNPEVYGEESPPSSLTSGSMGWRSFADMLPSIATNPVAAAAFTPPADAADVAHDWLEDALRHLPDRVSFRQNIFVVVVAAQTLSPASTLSRPVVLADQRAAVTVIRDAFTGRWTIHSWRWLAE